MSVCPVDECPLHCGSELPAKEAGAGPGPELPRPLPHDERGEEAGQGRQGEGARHHQHGPPGQDLEHTTNQVKAHEKMRRSILGSVCPMK